MQLYQIVTNSSFGEYVLLNKTHFVYLLEILYLSLHWESQSNQRDLYCPIMKWLTHCYPEDKRSGPCGHDGMSHSFQKETQHGPDNVPPVSLLQHLAQAHPFSPTISPCLNIFICPALLGSKGWIAPSIPRCVDEM